MKPTANINRFKMAVDKFKNTVTLDMQSISNYIRL